MWWWRAHVLDGLYSFAWVDHHTGDESIFHENENELHWKENNNKIIESDAMQLNDVLINGIRFSRKLMTCMLSLKLKNVKKFAQAKV